MKKLLCFLAGGLLCPVYSGATPSVSPKNSETMVVSDQQISVKGKVLDKKTGEPLVGVKVSVKGTGRGVVTNLDGAFSLSAKEGATIEVAFVGYKPYLFKVLNGNKPITIRLEEDSKELDEVVVVGYGTQKKVNLTGSVASIDTKQLNNRSNTNVLKSIQGTVPGVTIISRPGSTPSINFRGRGNLGTSSPLYVIDGVISSPSDFQNLDPNTIESVSFLKDAASSAIYGARAAYGVVLVKTKEGKKGAVKVTYNGLLGIKNPTYISKIVSSAEYARLANEAVKNSNPNAKPVYTDDQIKLFENGSEPNKYPNSQWFDMLLTKNPITYQHSLGVSGGELVRFYVGLGYVKDHNFVPGNSMDRYNLTSNLVSDIKPWLSMRVNFKGVLSNTENKNGIPALMEFLRTPTTMVAKHTDGSFGTYNGGVLADKEGLNRNPYRSLHDGSWNMSNSKKVTVNVGFDLKPFKGLRISSDLSYEAANDKSKSYTASRPKLLDFFKKTPIDGSERPENKMSMYWSEGTHMIANTTINYNKKIANHEFTFLGGVSYEDIYFQSLYASRKGFPSNALTDIAAGSNAPSDMYGGASGNKNDRGINQYKIFSLFSRLNYDYAGKYLVEINVRSDASSRFAPKYRTAVFPSFSLAWRVSEEDFLKDVEWLNNLKLRVSKGSLGSINNIGNYDYFATYKSGGNYVFDGDVAVGIVENKPANEKLSWEKVSILDLGIDLNVLNNRLSLTADYYNKLTQNILLVPNIMNEVGLSSKPSQNMGKVLNRGLEISATWRDRLGDLEYSIGSNMSYNKNEILNLGDSDPLYEGAWIKKVGKSIGTFYGYRTNGLLTQADIDGKKYITDGIVPQAGDIKYVDLNGNGKLDQGDRDYIGSDVPYLTYGVNLSLSYKGFDFSVFGQGIKGTKVKFGEEQAFAFFDNATPREFHLKRWTVNNPNPHAAYPRIYARTDGHSKFNQKFSDFWLFDSDYFRIKNISLGYSFSHSIAQRLGLSSLKVYMNLENYITFRKDKRMMDFDPEAASGRGVSAFGEKTMSFGLNLTL